MVFLLSDLQHHKYYFPDSGWEQNEINAHFSCVTQKIMWANTFEMFPSSFELQHSTDVYEKWASDI